MKIVKNRDFFFFEDKTTLNVRNNWDYIFSTYKNRFWLHGALPADQLQWLITCFQMAALPRGS